MSPSRSAGAADDAHASGGGALVDNETALLTAFTAVAGALTEHASVETGLRRALHALMAASPAVVGGTAMLFRAGADAQDLVVSEASSAGSTRRLAIPGDVVRRTIEKREPLVERYASPPSRRGLALSGAAGSEIVRATSPVMLGGRVVGLVALHHAGKPDSDVAGLGERACLFAAMVAQSVAARQSTDRDVDADVSQPRRRVRFRELVGASGSFELVHAQVAQVAPTTTTVLIRGESGTGKGLVAQAIHQGSPRARRPFVTVSCAALPSDLIEAELFGYEKGAFTGASATRKGRLEAADGGTVFLDEVGELTPAVQVKLLRVLQAREFERLGGTQTIPLDIRVLAATNRNLEKAMASGQFREDLFYRLNVFSVFVPPLRERKADVLLLADHFLEKYAREHNKAIRRIATPAIDMLMSYHWPGNVRELANVIERAVIVCDSGVVHSHHLPPTLQTAESSGTVMRQSLQEIVQAVERDALQDALKTTRGSRTKAAQLLGTTRRILNYKLRNYSIDWRRFASSSAIVPSADGQQRWRSRGSPAATSSKPPGSRA